MKIAIFIPNLSRKSCGGAETYALNIAEVLSKKHEITIYTCANFTKGFNIKEKYDRYGAQYFETKYVMYIPTGHERLKEVIDLLLEPMLYEVRKKYDLFINAAQNRVRAPKNIKSMHIIHFPEQNLVRIWPNIIAKYLNARYINSYSVYLPNSEFTKYYFEQYWQKKSSVLYAPIKLKPIEKLEMKKKEDIILAVDRIVEDKKILEMINAYKGLVDKNDFNYKFVIIGAPNPKYMNYFQEVIKAKKGYNIEIFSDLSMEDLQRWYKKAKIFWHAKGYKVEDDNPFNMEHFGSTTVEAMINGCVPIVINKAGQKEIVLNELQGFKWDSIQELQEKTLLIAKNHRLREEIGEAAIERAKDFLMPQFEKKLQNIVSQLFTEEYR